MPSILYLAAYQSNIFIYYLHIIYMPKPAKFYTSLIYSAGVIAL